MSISKTLLVTVIAVAAVALTGCETVTDSQKDYTVKTVKSSPAPRNKFYDIVKVPKPAAAADAPKG